MYLKCKRCGEIMKLGDPWRHNIQNLMSGDLSAINVLHTLCNKDADYAAGDLQFGDDSKYKTIW